MIFYVTSFDMLFGKHEVIKDLRNESNIFFLLLWVSTKIKVLNTDIRWREGHVYLFALLSDRKIFNNYISIPYIPRKTISLIHY